MSHLTVCVTGSAICRENYNTDNERFQRRDRKRGIQPSPVRALLGALFAWGYHDGDATPLFYDYCGGKKQIPFRLQLLHSFRGPAHNHNKQNSILLKGIDILDT